MAAWLCLALASCGAAGGPQTELNAESRLRVGEAAERSGDKDTAIAMYSAAAESAPEDASVQVRVANGLARSGRWSQARDLLQARLKSRPRDPDLLRALASIHVMVGQTRVAIARFDEVLAILPLDIGALTGKAVALDIQSRHAEAQALYRRALAIAPDDPVISNNLALSLMMDGQLNAAQVVLAPFVDADDVPERLKINLGIILAANGNMEMARALLNGHLGDAELLALTRAASRPRKAPAIVP
ncbi:MAG: tetratricopeptide repeat protein [Alphaproteobacteria bacterium]|nr:tetratricopeptide repeat protein [Alphaproteobacteria bacterium]